MTATTGTRMIPVGPLNVVLQEPVLPFIELLNKLTKGDNRSQHRYLTDTLSVNWGGTDYRCTIKVGVAQTQGVLALAIDVRSASGNHEIGQSYREKIARYMRTLLVQGGKTLHGDTTYDNGQLRIEFLANGWKMVK